MAHLSCCVLGVVDTREGEVHLKNDVVDAILLTLTLIIHYNCFFLAKIVRQAAQMFRQRLIEQTVLTKFGRTGLSSFFGRTHCDIQCSDKAGKNSLIFLILRPNAKMKFKA